VSVREYLRARLRPAPPGSAADAFIATVVGCFERWPYSSAHGPAQLRKILSLEDADFATLTDQEIARLTPNADPESYRRHLRTKLNLTDDQIAAEYRSDRDDFHQHLRSHLILTREIYKLAAAPDDIRRDCLLRFAELYARPPEGLRRDTSLAMAKMFALAARKRVQLAPADVTAILSLVRDTAAEDRFRAADLARLWLKQLPAAITSWPAEERTRIAPLVEETAVALEHNQVIGAHLRDMVATHEALKLDVIATDAAGQALRAAFAASTEQPPALSRLLALLAGYPAQGKVTKRWASSLAAARAGLAEPAALAAALLDALLAAGDTEYPHQPGRSYFRFFSGGNELLACGIAAFAGSLAAAAPLPALRRLAVKAVTVTPGEYGVPRSLRLANACVHAIAGADAPSSVAELLALERAVRHSSLRKQIRTAIDALASARRISRDELLELAVDGHRLDAGGRLERPLSRGSALIEAGATTATLSYLDESGKPRRTFPAGVRKADADQIPALRRQVQAIRTTIAGQRQRLDQLMALDRRWPLPAWRERYLDHPVTGRLTRALIWAFRGPDGTTVVGLPTGPASVLTSAGEHLAIPLDAEVRLWHPVAATAMEVAAWRRRLLEESITQPVRQAFRERYLPTPAEAHTGVYSNRFAGHVLRQAAARALMKQRGWAPSPLPIFWWDKGIDPGTARACRGYEPFGVRAEFFFDPILDIDADDSQRNPDIKPYCTSDQVRFSDATTGEPIALHDVPPLVFSEAMRDVDLFIGVTSIGADPNWLDRGRARQFDPYWHDFGSGELNAAAQVRREVIERLLPRLAIADRCRLDERYLLVRGDIRSYRIHLGSGNVLMSPDDSYLCIVAARDPRAGKVFLPFDDDARLSLILSKAFLLADDSQITDPSITRQITLR
jgi:hypothetical protein